MTRQLKATAIIEGKDKTSAAFRSAAANMLRLQSVMSRASGQMAAMERMSGALRMGLVGVASAVSVGGMAQTVKRFGEVDRAMTRTGITGDATAEQTREGMIDLRDMARDVALPFDKVQAGLDKITSSGREFGDAMKMMPSVTRTAQASGASVEDIADSSTALIDHMKISIEGLAAAQDTLAKGGQLGKFELKDMARYLPSMLPAFKAIGYEGQQGLEKLVALLQVIRGGTGTAEEAAASANNIFQKMESEATVKNFKDMGVDLPKAMIKARKEGKDLIQVFTELSNKALKGDLSKLPQLFNDSEFARGMRALLTGEQKRKEILAGLKDAKGTIDRNLKRVADDTQASIDRLSEGFDRAKTAFGGFAAVVGQSNMQAGAGNLDDIAQSMERLTKAARELGVVQAVTDAAGELGRKILKQASEGREELADGGRESEDREILKAMRERARTPPSTFGANMPANSAAARLLNPKRPAGMSEKEMAAFMREQQRLQGNLKPGAYTPSSPDLTSIAVAAAYEQRDKAYMELPSATRVKLSKAVKNAPLPPSRPDSLKPTITVPTQGLDDAGSSAERLKALILDIGPSGGIAGSKMASGLLGGLSKMEADVDAAVSRMQQKLQSLKAPSLSFGGSGGFNTGTSTAGTE